MILDANGSMLTPALIQYCLVELSPKERQRCKVLLSPRNADWLKRQHFLRPDEIHEHLAPHAWVQDDTAFIMGGDDGLEQLWQIKNLYPGPKEEKPNE
jgi:hypothetical protein